jgi:hypothetical protein
MRTRGGILCALALAAGALLMATPLAGAATPHAASPNGYWLVGADGGIFNYGSAQFYGSTGSMALQRPVIGIVATPTGNGYWLDATDGGVFAYGTTQYYGSLPGLGYHPFQSDLPNSLNAPIAGMVASHDDQGYFMVGEDGGVFAFGDAKFEGSCYTVGGCQGAAVSVIPDATGNGYWLVTTFGAVYAFGDAKYLGGPGFVPASAAAPTPDGNGYVIVTLGGTVYGFGDAPVTGSIQAGPSSYGPATAVFLDAQNNGGWVAYANGLVAAFGSAPFLGDAGGLRLNEPVTAGAGF